MSATVPPWDATYPSAAALRAEADALRECIVETVLDVLPGGSVLGVYAGGSSLKPWDSVVDYVPELSDVDIHLLLTDEALLEGDLDRTFAVQADYERRFTARYPQPLHQPRPQVVVINKLIADPAFMGPPAGATRTLFGRPHEEVRPPPTDFEFVRKVDRERLLEPRDQAWVAGLPAHTLDRPFKYLWQPVRDAAWRVAPAGPRVLSILGEGFDDAWGHNRTWVANRLHGVGQAEFGDAYVGYYVECWRYFLSGYRDNAAARSALLRAKRVIELGAELARSA